MDKKRKAALNRPKKVPVIMQHETLECGAASLAMILAYYGKWVPLEQVRSDCDVSRDGSNARNICLAATRYGFEVKVYRQSVESIRNKGQFPCIIHWNFNHFVVLNGFRGKYAYINDPARGFLMVSPEEFDKSFTGIMIYPVPGENFVREGKKKSIIEFAVRRLKGSGSACIFMFMIAVITALFSIINPAMSKIYIDHILWEGNKEWLKPFIMLMTVLAFLQIISSWIHAIYSLKINGKMAVIGSAEYMANTLSKPIDFFSQRLASDILARQNTNENIAEALVNTFAPLLLNIVMMIFYLILMARQSLLLTAIGIGALFLNILVTQTISKLRMNLTRIMQRDTAQLSSHSFVGIEMIETIKANGAENGFFQKWAEYQASVNTQMIKSIKIESYLGLIPTFLSASANYAVLILGVYFVINGQFTLGGLQMFQGLLGAFMTPATMLVTASQTIQEMRTQIERIEDVMDYPVDQNVLYSQENTDRGSERLTGDIELKNVTFGYSKLSKPIINNLSIKIKQGSNVAFVGASGCGKSTIAKLITGLYNPDAGEILYDGKPRNFYSRMVMTSSIAAVDQDILIFEGTIADNIKMWDESIEDFEMILAARDAQLHDDIMLRRNGYQAYIMSEGRNLSGGQCQRLEIARALAQDPSILIMDEATSALDARTEQDVVKAIKDRGMTCIMIAHRLSTIRNCDQIYVMDKGQIIENGTHDELIKLNGTYKKLVMNA